MLTCTCMHFAIPEVLSERADRMQGFKNPYITLKDLEHICHDDENLQFCLKEMIQYSLRYAETVCRFELIVSRDRSFGCDGIREEIEQVRSSIHDSTIVAINILSRALKNRGKENGWIASMATGGRAVYGKFAILIAFEVVARRKENNVRYR